MTSKLFEQRPPQAAPARKSRHRVGIALALCFALFASILNMSPASAQADTEAPSRPGARGYSMTDDSVTIKWQASTDNVAVVSYRVRLIGTDHDVTLPAKRRAMKFRNVAPKNRYVYAVSAIDAEGNVSAERRGAFRMMTPAQSSQSVAAVYAVEEALELWAATNGNFNTGGRNGQGWFAFENETTYQVRMVDTLIDAGFLDESFRDIHPQDLMLYRCGRGANQRVAVFSSSMRAISSVDAENWDGCNQRPITTFGRNYFRTTRTLGEIAAEPFGELTIWQPAYDAQSGQFYGNLQAPYYQNDRPLRWVIESPAETIYRDSWGQDNTGYFLDLFAVDQSLANVDGTVEVNIYVESVGEQENFRSATHTLLVLVYED